MLAQTKQGVCRMRDFCRTLRKHSCGDGSLSDDLGGSRLHGCWPWERLGGCFALHCLYDEKVYVDCRRITMGVSCDKEYGDHD